jgi:hypothetical protein
MGYKTKLVLAGGFALAVGVTVTAFAQGGGGSTATPAASPNANRPARAGCGRAQTGRRAGRLVHGTLEVQLRQGFGNVTLDRGTITSVDESAHTLTIERADGQSVTATASDRTRICVEGHAGTFDQLKTGDRAGIVQLDYQGRHVVRRILDVGPATSSGTRAGAGSNAAASAQTTGLSDTDLLGI